LSKHFCEFRKMVGRAAAFFVALSCLMLAAGVASLAQEIVPPPDRDVTPPNVTPAPSGEGPLIRQPTPPRPPEPARWQRYFLPVTTDAATFKVKDGTVRVAGVAAVPRDAACEIADGGTWPCGRTALNALRMFLRGRAVECFFAIADMNGEIAAPCRVGRTDLGLWLLSQGWVGVGEGASDEYRAAARQARCANRGLWRTVEREESCPPRKDRSS
jgi:endonuclease YncB( thermonuclease family)